MRNLLVRFGRKLGVKGRKLGKSQDDYNSPKFGAIFFDMSNTKQVLVIRKDLKMRRGKENAQVSHASMAFLTRRLFGSFRAWLARKLLKITKAEEEWLLHSFAKVGCCVESEEELLDIEKRAKEAGVEVHLITDSGRTEFHGVPTSTCLALGPDYSERLDPISGNLKLY